MLSLILFDEKFKNPYTLFHEITRMSRMSVIGIRWVLRMFQSRSHWDRYLWSSWVVPWKSDHYNRLESCLILEYRQRWDLRGLIRRHHSSIEWSMWSLMRKISPLRVVYMLNSTRTSKSVSLRPNRSWYMSCLSHRLSLCLRHIVTPFLIRDKYPHPLVPRVLRLSWVWIPWVSLIHWRRVRQNRRESCWIRRPLRDLRMSMIWMCVAYYVAEVREIETLTVSVSFAESVIFVRILERRYPELTLAVPSTNVPTSLIVSPPTSVEEKNLSRYAVFRSAVLCVKSHRTSSVPSCVSVSATAATPLHNAR